tara:strand:- start:84 stop:842 length:759 start_codon:yes stop_codon:yes gene_type:complete
MNLKLITLTNKGYLEYTQNLIESLKKLNISNKLEIYCIDQVSFNFLKNKYNENMVYYVQNNYNISDIQLFRDGNWNKVVYYKFQIIKENLDKGYDVLFTDGDIVFLKNPFEYLKNNVNEYDLLFQEDVLPDEKDNKSTLATKKEDPLHYSKDEICTGFMFAKCNNNNKILFDSKSIDIEKFVCDQLYVNDLKNHLNYKLLDRDLFPSGYYYYTQKSFRDNDLDKNAFIIHFNYNTPWLKTGYMKKYGKWFLD